MKKLFVVFSMAVALIGVTAFSAVATPINGAISFSGTSVQDNVDLSLVTAFTGFSNVVVSSTGGTGDYAPVVSGQSVAFSAFTFLPSLIPNPVVALWAFIFDGKTYSFDATGLVISPGTTSHTIAMQGPGIAHITGFEDTPGNWYFSANRAGTTASFSSSSDVVSAVPEPGTMLLLGMGLVGVGAFSKRKLKKA